MSVGTNECREGRTWAPVFSIPTTQTHSQHYRYVLFSRPHAYTRCPDASLGKEDPPITKKETGFRTLSNLVCLIVVVAWYACLRRNWTMRHVSDRKVSMVVAGGLVLIRHQGVQPWWRRLVGAYQAYRNLYALIFMRNAIPWKPFQHYWPFLPLKITSHEHFLNISEATGFWKHWQTWKYNLNLGCWNGLKVFKVWPKVLAKMC